MMNKRRKIFGCVLFVLLFAFAMIGMWNYYPDIKTNVKLKVDVQGEEIGKVQMYYTLNNTCTVNDFTKDSRAKRKISENKAEFDIPSNAKYVRFHFGQEGVYRIQGVSVASNDKTIEISEKDISTVADYQSISACFIDENGQVYVEASADDPYMVWDLSEYDISSLTSNQAKRIYKEIHIIGSCIIVLACVAVFLLRKKIIKLYNEIIDDRKIIINLTKTDFKAKYSGSYFGVFWAFVQPIVTIAIYTFVFQIGFKAGNTVSGFPFLLYLVAGIIPWFFFAEAWMGATNCLTEYNYLVKKVVFKIEALPMVKIMSSMIVHLFFILLAFILFSADGHFPNYTLIQLPYYLICTVFLVAGLAYLSAAISPFFKDIYQIISILTQLGMWTIPIMYDEAIIGERIMKILRLNPMYYIVTGYRDCFMHGSWIWDKMSLTFYFWLISSLIFIIGYRMFKKLKIHFADVL